MVSDFVWPRGLGKCWQDGKVEEEGGKLFSGWPNVGNMTKVSSFMGIRTSFWVFPSPDLLP